MMDEYSEAMAGMSVWSDMVSAKNDEEAVVTDMFESRMNDLADTLLDGRQPRVPHGEGVTAEEIRSGARDVYNYVSALWDYKSGLSVDGDYKKLTDMELHHAYYTAANGISSLPSGDGQPMPGYDAIYDMIKSDMDSLRLCCDIAGNTVDMLDNSVAAKKLVPPAQLSVHDIPKRQAASSVTMRPVPDVSLAQDDENSFQLE